MDYDRDGNVIQIITDGGESGSTDQADWAAAEHENRLWNSNVGSETTPSNSNYEPRQSQLRSWSEPPSKKLRFSSSKDGEEIVVAHEDEREEFQIPAVGSSSCEWELTQRSNMNRRCKKFYSEEGCPDGDICPFRHDRQSDAIILGLGAYSGGGSGSGNGRSGSASAGGAGGNLKPSNWKTRPCYKWERMGYCSSGDKCRFAHGATESHRYGSGLMEGERRDSASVVASATPVAHSDVHHIGAPSQRPSTVIQRPSTVIQRPGHMVIGSTISIRVIISLAPTLQIEDVFGVWHMLYWTPTPTLQLLPFSQFIMGVFVSADICRASYVQVRASTQIQLFGAQKN